MCLICMKYRIIILIIIIISLGKISVSYIANTSRTHTCTHARAHTLTLAYRHTPTPPRPSLFAVSVRPISPSWLGPPLSTLARQWPVGDPLKETTCGRLCINDMFGVFSRIKQIIGRTETRTRDRICYQMIRSV